MNVRWWVCAGLGATSTMGAFLVLGGYPDIGIVTTGYDDLGVSSIPQSGEVSDWTFAIILFATYSRYNDISPLEHELRADIIQIVDALPGIYLAQLIARTDRPASTVRYHTRVLDREDELQRASVWGNLRLYPADTDPASFAYYAAIRDPASARVLRVIAAYEPVTPGRLADLVGRAPSTISHHLARFEDEELIERRRDGESVHVQLADTVRSYTSNPGR